MAHAKLPNKYFVGHTRVFVEPLQICNAPLAIGGSGQLYKAKTEAGNWYCVKMFKPYDEGTREWDRRLLSTKNISISDADLDSCFDLWHRESRVYERIDEYIKGPTRYLFLEYYGTITLSYSACPDAWCQHFPDYGEVHAIVLGLLEQPRYFQMVQEIDLNDSFVTMVKQLWTEINDHEYIHIFVHLYEMVDLLHQINIIHADLKPDNLADHDITKSSVLFDFSNSWAYTNNLPCLDPFKRKPRTFDERREGELDAVRQLVIRRAPAVVRHNT